MDTIEQEGKATWYDVTIVDPNDPPALFRRMYQTAAASREDAEAEARTAAAKSGLDPDAVTYKIREVRGAEQELAERDGLEVGGLIALDDAIAKYGADEVVGGDAMELGWLREHHPHVTIYIEEQLKSDGQPWFEWLWVDLTAIRGDEEDGKTPQLPTGDETYLIREDGRDYLVTWYD